MDQRTLIDELIPQPNFRKFHSIRVLAPADQAWKAIRAVTADEILLFRTLTWLRRLGRPSRYAILNPPAGQPLIEAMMRNEFSRLGEEPGREIVVGTLVVQATGALDPRRWKAKDFTAVREPGFVKLAMNFQVTEVEPAVCVVSTETRAAATDPATYTRFRRYWLLISPGGSFIRRMWLRAIRMRAEGV
jgi:hypothetical protein